MSTYTLPERITDRVAYEGYTNIATFNLVATVDNDETLYTAKMKWVNRRINQHNYSVTATQASDLYRTLLCGYNLRYMGISYTQTNWQEIAECLQAEIVEQMNYLREYFHSCDNCVRVTIEHPETIKRFPLNDTENVYLCVRCYMQMKPNYPSWPKWVDAKEV